MSEKRLKCKSCIWYELNQNECRRSAPTYKGWPKTAVLDWCGEFRLMSEDNTKSYEQIVMEKISKG